MSIPSHSRTNHLKSHQVLYIFQYKDLLLDYSPLSKLCLAHIMRSPSSF